MTSEIETCLEPEGPNCGACCCRLTKGHEGQHLNWHGTQWPIPKREEQWPYTEIAALRAALTEAQADANNLALALTCWDSEHPATCDCPACSVLIKALARHAALHTPTGAGTTEAN